MRSLEIQLERALMGAMQGDAWSPLLAGRLKREARAVLMRNGLERAIVEVGYDGSTVQVRITLPAGPQRVRTLELTLAGG